ncbi:MAG TPA: 4-hydroxythreonine-4-phosphate dehydrogenase PdxA [Armatimonadota bacterium]|nr:4-hydroxythreonine-4-phosphate dehydrogenase PdxA [Armatimonadota bacterium]
MHKPRIAVTMGDPAGVGPEIVLRALQSETVAARCRPVVVGHPETLKRCAQAIGLGNLEIVSVSEPGDVETRPGRVVVVPVEVPGLEAMQPGVIQAVCGRAADAFVHRACELGLSGAVDAIATPPINKEALRAAGVPYIGHTEMLASYLNAPEPLTLFITGQMRIFFLSRHLSLRQAIDYITRERVFSMLRLVHTAMTDFGFPAPKIGVAALNPHASDGGLFGDEEARHLLPAVADARAAGIDAVGPIGADSVFNQALEGQFDCVLSLYHDQGHIAAKTRDFYGTVTATLGLPVLRTSVDHGTAFDIAWQGKANPVSMEAAILAAVDLLARRA